MPLTSAWAILPAPINPIFMAERRESTQRCVAVDKCSDQRATAIDRPSGTDTVWCDILLCCPRGVGSTRTNHIKQSYTGVRVDLNDQRINPSVTTHERSLPRRLCT